MRLVIRLFCHLSAVWLSIPAIIKADSLELIFSVPHGYYQKPFELIISSEDDIDQVWYTLDNRSPLNSASGIIINAPATILVDPQADNMPAISPCVVVRALGIKNNVIVTPLYTRTYIFPNQMTELSPDGVRPGVDWPDTNSVDTTHQYFDYGMDPDVFNDARYSSLIIDALLNLPSLSIVSDPENLFNPDSGIYVNARQDGVEWERKCSLELIDPEGDVGFQINAGVRIRGGDSRRNANPKHSFRFLFKGEYGLDQLDYPLFGDEGVDKFDRIDLRTNQNYSWHATDPYRAAKNTFIREIFSRDTQKDMELPYTRSRQYHVYLNGQYWGLYMTQERPEENFGASYFGGDEQDYDILKIDKNNDNKIYATNGATDSWQRLWSATMAGLSTNKAYFKIQGLNPDGTKNASFEKLLDLENFISYLLIYYYTGNYDGIVGLQWNNQKPNNFWALYKFTDPDGYKFFAHDCEQSMASEDGKTIGLYDDRTGPFEQLGEWYWFNGQELHQELVNNAEYRISFADYVYKYFYNDGPLIPQNCINRFIKRAQEIDLAVIAESARWGDSNFDRKYNPRTKDDDWKPAVNDLIENYFPYRRDVVVQQLREDGWYPAFQPPLFIHEGDTIQRSEFEVLSGYKIELIRGQNPKANIVYTVNDEDPRTIGGGINANAISSIQNILLKLHETTSLKARIKIGDQWSALHRVKFEVFEPNSNLIITEIQYHPLPQGNFADDEFEFIEVKNIGDKPFYIGNAFFDEGIEYTFPLGTIIEKDGFLVLASNAELFKYRYGFAPFDQYTGRLDNDGERIELKDALSKTILSVKYDDDASWPQMADGEGYSLTTLYPNDFVDPDNFENWTVSTSLYGTPGRDDTINNGTIRESPVQGFNLFQNYPNPFNLRTTIKYHVLEQTKIEINVFTTLGQNVAMLVNEVKPPGIFSVSFNAGKLASGIYIVRMKAGRHTFQKKVVFLK